MENILVVENNKVFLKLFSSYLEGKGYAVFTAEDGLAALEVLETMRGQWPQVIFVDLVMPRINGEKFCRIVRRMPELREIPLVIVSAIAAEGEVDFVAFGADVCIAKGPFKVMQGYIDAVLEHAAADNLAPLRGNIYGVEGIHKRQITRELIAVGRHFEVTLDNMADGFFEMTQDGAILSANRAAAEMFDSTVPRLLSSSLLDLFDEVGRRRVQEACRSLNETSIEIGVEEPVVVNDRYLLLKFVPLREGDHFFIIVFVHDVSRSKRAELALLQHQDHLEELVAQRTAALEAKNAELEEALAKVRMLSGLLPICASCKKIRDDSGYWNQIEVYIRRHSEAEFSHSLCPDCAQRLYPRIFKEKPEG